MQINTANTSDITETDCKNVNGKRNKVVEQWGLFQGIYGSSSEISNNEW